MCSQFSTISLPTSPATQYKYNGNTVTGKLYKKSPASTDSNPLWIVTPMDRRRRNEDISEKSLGNIISEAEATMNRGPKLNNGSGSGNNKVDDSIDEEVQQQQKRRSGRTTPSSGSSGGMMNNNKRKSSYEEVPKKSSGVTFSQQESNVTANTTSTNKKNTTKKSTTTTKQVRVGTRSKGTTTKMLLLPDNLPPMNKRKNSNSCTPKVKKFKKDENVTVVKMLTGNLYLYRGDRPRAEFVRSK